MATSRRGTAGTDREARPIERFLTAYVAGDPQTMAKVVTADCVVHQVWLRDTVGRERLVAGAGEMDTFGDVSVTVERLVVDGDHVVAAVNGSGRNVGPVRMDDRKTAPPVAPSRCHSSATTVWRTAALRRRGCWPTRWGSSSSSATPRPARGNCMVSRSGRRRGGSGDAPGTTESPRAMRTIGRCQPSFHTGRDALTYQTTVATRIRGWEDVDVDEMCVERLLD
jgi:hypothetical protein